MLIGRDAQTELIRISDTKLEIEHRQPIIVVNQNQLLLKNKIVKLKMAPKKRHGQIGVNGRPSWPMINESDVELPDATRYRKCNCFECGEWCQGHGEEGNVGYYGDGLSCTDMNECFLDKDHNLSNKCHPMADCINTLGSYECDCLTGFAGNGRDCQDIDECDQNDHKCDDNATCSNLYGTYECTCNEGYR